MTPAELQQKVQNVVASVNTAASLASSVAPALVPYIALGQIVDQMIPGLVGTVDAWVQGTEPTAEEIADFQAKLTALADPNAP